MKAICYLVRGNIQHLPPIVRLQTLIPASIIVSEEAVYTHIQDKYPELAVNTVWLKTTKEIQRYLRINKIRLVVLSAFRGVRRTLEVQVFHGGLSDKTHLENPILSTYDLVLFPGQKSVDKVKKFGILDKLIDWQIVGYPKFDPLVNGDVFAAPEFDNNRPTVLYAPTWISSTRPQAAGCRGRRLSIFTVW